MKILLLLRLLILSLGLSALVTACGMQGDLYLPAEKPSAAPEKLNVTPENTTN